MRGNMPEEIISEINLLDSIIQISVIKSKIIGEYTLQATVQLGIAIEFKLICSNDLYLDIKFYSHYVNTKITKTEPVNIEAKRTALINLTLKAIFQEISVVLHCRNKGVTIQEYS